MIEGKCRVHAQIALGGIFECTEVWLNTIFNHIIRGANTGKNWVLLKKQSPLTFCVPYLHPIGAQHCLLPAKSVAHISFPCILISCYAMLGHVSLSGGSD